MGKKLNWVASVGGETVEDRRQVFLIGSGEEELGVAEWQVLGCNKSTRDICRQHRAKTATVCYFGISPEHEPPPIRRTYIREVRAREEWRERGGIGRAADEQRSQPISPTTAREPFGGESTPPSPFARRVLPLARGEASRAPASTYPDTYSIHRGLSRNQPSFVGSTQYPAKILTRLEQRTAPTYSLDFSYRFWSLYRFFDRYISGHVIYIWHVGLTDNSRISGSSYNVLDITNYMTYILRFVNRIGSIYRIIFPITIDVKTITCLKIF